ncbi:hypothetical protein CANMA_002189 [Candida margitis]|uniref:uncharacterized protein n=1 Tax=Candida margitis TaxID=1775924 RepID=UPI002226E915|nr:uncharacterized protein CANMA_002189 [Candida margitis]KAI5968753.1 hypothetical protein CANMA_002189 [Candida margitis]
MIDILLQSTQEWLSCWFLEVNNYPDPKTLQGDLAKLLDNIDTNQFTILVLKQRDWYLYNYIQMMVLKTGKSIVVNYLMESPEHHLKVLAQLVKQVDSMDLKIGFDLSKEQLAFLMLNVPGFINHLAGGEPVEDVDVDAVFQEFITRYPSIKSIVSSNEFAIE